MDIQIHQTSRGGNLLYGDTSTASPSHIQQRTDDNSSTASTTSKGSNANVLESVKSLQDMVTVTNTLQSLDKAYQLLSNKFIAQIDEVSEIPPK